MNSITYMAKTKMQMEGELKALLDKWMIVNQDVVSLPIPPPSKGH